MRENKLKQQLAAGERVFGAVISTPSPELVEICGLAGFDFVFIDGEHGPISPGEAAHMIRAADAIGVTPLVRVRQNEPSLILQYLDVGAAGIVIPHVNTAADVKAAVQAIKYFPQGKRGLAGTRSSDYGLSGRLGEYTQEANRETLVVALIEDIDALDDLREIVMVDELDVVTIGPNDLSQTMGLPGQTDHMAVQDAIETIIDRARAGGKIAGLQAANPGVVQRYSAHGARFFHVGPMALLGAACREYLRAARGG